MLALEQHTVLQALTDSPGVVLDTLNVDNCKQRLIIFMIKGVKR